MDESPREHNEPIEEQRAAEPPIEDLFRFVHNPVDFMSAQSFPASDPPPAQWIVDQGGD